MNILDLEKYAETLKSMGHPLRLKILFLLKENKENTVTEIYTQLKIEQAVTSHHLKILKNHNVVSVKKSGKSSLYRIKSQNIKNILNQILKVDQS